MQSLLLTTVYGLLCVCVYRMLAIDIGASPGGWSHYLSGHVGYVLAIDPSELDDRILAIENIEHIQKRADEAIPDIEMALKNFPNSSGVDVCVIDMNVGDRDGDGDGDGDSDEVFCCSALLNSLLTPSCPCWR